jgi:hypothetical protein
MKILSALLLALTAPAMICLAHGPGHVHRPTAAVINESLDEQTPAPLATSPATRSSQAGGKNFREPVIETSQRNWGASLTTGYESRHVHYGVNETGNHGAWTNEIGLWIGDLGLSAWNGFGLGTDFEEWDFTVSYTFEAGPVFFIPGYNFRWQPQSGNHAHAHEDHGDHSDEEDEHHDEKSSHAHREYNNELFAILGTNAIPYITPSTAFIWNLNDSPGGLLEFRIDGEIPVVKETLTLNPYALLGLNFGYNTTAEYGLNNFQFGIQADWRINKYLVAFAGINYSVALPALQAIDQPSVAWANAGVRLEY